MRPRQTRSAGAAGVVVSLEVEPSVALQELDRLDRAELRIDPVTGAESCERKNNNSGPHI